MWRNNYYDIYFKTSTELVFGKFGTAPSWRWMKAMALAESGLDPEALSVAGARGVMQLMPATARWMAETHGIANRPDVPHINIRLGVCYAHRCWKIWTEESGIERVRFMVGSYNAGPGNIIKAQRITARRGLPTDRWEHIARALPRVTGEHAEETVCHVTKVENFFARLTTLTEGETP